jgi:hypothetical protein
MLSISIPVGDALSDALVQFPGHHPYQRTNRGPVSLLYYSYGISAVVEATSCTSMLHSYPPLGPAKSIPSALTIAAPCASQ